MNKVKLLGNIFMIFSATCVSFSTEYAVSLFPYLSFLFSHCLWLYAALKEKESYLIYLMSYFIMLDLYACYIRI